MAKKEIIHSDAAPEAVGPYSQAVRTGDTLYVSGQIGIDPDSGEVVSDRINDQTVQVMDNLNAILEEAGASLEDVVKTTVYLTNMDHYEEFNHIYSRYFDRVPPARACVEVCELPAGVLVEVDLIASLSDE